MKKLMLLTILIPSIAMADNGYYNNATNAFLAGLSQGAQGNTTYVQPQYGVPVAPVYVPQNNLERQMQNDYLQELTRNQQIKNRALEAEINNPNKGLVVPRVFGQPEY